MRECVVCGECVRVWGVWVMSVLCVIMVSG